MEALELSDELCELGVNNPDPNIRKIAAVAIPYRYAIKLVKDPNPSVRFILVARLRPEDLHLMMYDEIDWIRTQVASRIEVSRLPDMLLYDDFVADSGRERLHTIFRRMPRNLVPAEWKQRYEDWLIESVMTS